MVAEIAATLRIYIMYDGQNHGFRLRIRKNNPLIIMSGEIMSKPPFDEL